MANKKNLATTANLNEMEIGAEVITSAPSVSETAVEMENTVEVSTSTVLDKINETIKDVSESTVVISRSRKANESIDLNEEIPCTSLVYGKLKYVDPNGTNYIWNSMGATFHLPFHVLQVMRTYKPNYIEKPLIYINDARVVEYFRLLDIYEKVANLHDLDQMFNTGNLVMIREKIKEILSVGMRDALIAKVRTMISEDVLTNINIIKLLEEEVRIGLME